MVEKRMFQTKSCEGCRQAHDCKIVYEQLGCVQGPSVTSTVVVAFLLPIVVFVAALGGFGRLLGSALAEPYRTLLALVLALLVMAGVMWVVRILLRPHQETWFRKQQ